MARRTLRSTFGGREPSMRSGTKPNCSHAAHPRSCSLLRAELGGVANRVRSPARAYCPLAPWSIQSAMSSIALLPSGSAPMPLGIRPPMPPTELWVPLTLCQK